ncbi:hypothetical protein Q7P37_005996 [Cladosporium fusiforme]
MDQMPNDGLVNTSVFGDGQHLPYDDNLFPAGHDQAFNDASWGLHASAYQQPMSRAASDVPGWPQHPSHVSATNTPANFHGQPTVYGRSPLHSPASFAPNNVYAGFANPNYNNFNQPQPYTQHIPQQHINPAFQQQQYSTPPTATPQPSAPVEQQPPKQDEKSQPGFGYPVLPPQQQQQQQQQQQPANAAAQVPTTADQITLANAIPASEQNGRFSVIDFSKLVKATNSERLTMFSNMGKQTHEFPVNRSTALPAYVKRNSRNELKRLAKNDPKLQARLAAKSSLSDRSSTTSSRPVNAKGSESIKYESDSDSSSESDVSLYSDEEDDLAGAPLPSKRPEDSAKGAVEYDTIKALWRNKRKTIDAASIRKGLGDFWEVVKTIRDRWKTDSKAVEEAEASKVTKDLALLKSRVKDQRDMLEVAFRTALKHGFKSILELFSENASFLYLCYQYLLDRFKADDLNGQIPRMILEILSITTSITDEKLEKTFLGKILQRYVLKGDGKTKFYAKKILESASNNSKGKDGKPETDSTAGVKRSSAAAGNTTTAAPAKKPAVSSSTANGTATKNLTSAKKPADSAKPSTTTASTAATKTKTVQAKPSGFFAGLQSAGKKPGATAAAKPVAKPVGQRAPAPAKPAFNLAETLANLAKPKEEVKKPEPKPDTTRDNESPERKAKRVARLARGAAGVRWREAQDLVEIRYFSHDPAEELDHDASQMRDVKDVGGEGRMLKQHADMMDVDEDEDSAEDDSDSKYVPFQMPSEVDFSTVGQEDRDRQYAPYGGGKLQPDSPERAVREQYERDNIIVIYSDSSEIPPNPREPEDPYNGEALGPCKEFGTPPADFAAKANQRNTRKPMYSSVPTNTTSHNQAAPAPGLDFNAMIAAAQQMSQQSQAAPQQQQAAPQFNVADFMKQFQPAQPQQQSFPNYQQPFTFPQQQQQPAPAPAARPNGEPDISAILAALNPGNTAQQAPPAPAPFVFPPNFPMPPMPSFGAAPDNNNQQQQQQQQHQPKQQGEEAKKRAENPYYKTKACKYWQEGKCRKGETCSYLHE